MERPALIHIVMFRLYFLTLATVLLAGSVGAQPDASLQGTVTYDEVLQRDPLSLPQGTEVMAASIPRERRSTLHLRFQGDVASSESAVVASAGVISSGAVYYLDYGARRRLSQVSLGGEPFLVEGTIDQIDWRITGEESEYLEYPMLKATATIGSRAVEAWFTPSIPASLGPALYCGLPGLILVVTEDAGRKTVRATSVSIGPLTDPVVPPTEGRAVSSDEYAQIVSKYVEDAQRAMEESAEDDH